MNKSPSRQPVPGADLGGWYNCDPNYDRQKDDTGFAPGATFGPMDFGVGTI
jgi:hypothetical protein